MSTNKYALKGGFFPNSYNFFILIAHLTSRQIGASKTIIYTCIKINLQIFKIFD